MKKLFKSNKFKKILTISLVTLLAIGTLGVSLAFFGRDDFNKAKDAIKDSIVREETISDVNIVKNSNFSVSDSNISILDETTLVSGGKVVNDWYMHTNDSDLDFVITKTIDGLLVKNEGNGTFGINQVIADGGILYMEKDLSFTVCVDDIVYSKSFSLVGNELESIVVYDTLDFFVGVYSGSGQFKVVVEFKPGADVMLNWVQLELGNVFTGYVAPAVA